MIETIGKVKLNYEYYNGDDLYSDGDYIEDRLLDICMGGEKEIEHELLESREWSSLYHLSDVRKNIIEWYDFKQGASVLEIGSGCGAISGILSEKSDKLVCVELSKKRSLINAYRNSQCENMEILVGNFEDINFEEKFDYITLIGVLEYAQSYINSDNPYEEFLTKIKKYLKIDGKIIIAIENKIGLKYLNGAKEDHVRKPFVGIEDYKGVDWVRTFTKKELEKMFKRCGIDEYKFYYPYPDYKLPSAIYSDEYLPKKGDIRIWGKNYDTVRLSMYSDAIFADQICNEGLYPYFANSFLIICGEKNYKYKFIQYSNERKREYQTKTIITDSDKKEVVKKKYLYNKERQYDIMQTMNDKQKKLNDQFANVEYLFNEIDKDGISYSFLNGEYLDNEIAEYAHKTDLMIEKIKQVMKYIYKVNNVNEFKISKEFVDVFGEVNIKGKEYSLAVTNVDMIFQNIIDTRGKMVCFDYEWIFEFPVPIGFLKYRSGIYFYSKYSTYFSHKMNRNTFLEKIGVSKENLFAFEKMENALQKFVKGKNENFDSVQRYSKARGTFIIKGL